MQRAVAPRGIRRERHLATAAKRARDHALSFDGGCGVVVMQRCEPCREVRAVGANLDAERALPAAATVVGIEQRADALAQTQTLQAGCGQNDRRVIAAIEFRQTRVQIAAQRPHFEVRITHAQHGLAAQAGGADHGAGRQCGERVVLVGDQRVARIFALHDGGQRKAFGQLHRHVFERVHGEVRAAVGESGFQFLHEEALTTNLRQSAIEYLIATCCHSEDFYVTRWI